MTDKYVEYLKQKGKLDENGKLIKNENDEKNEKKIFTRTRAWLRRAQLSLKDMSEEEREQQVLKIRAEFIPRWMEEAKIERWEDMDFSKFPQIHLEYELCDPVILRALQKPKGRELLFQRLTEEEQYIYLNERGSAGRTYAEDLEGRRGFNRGTIVKTVVKYKKSKKMSKMK